MYESSPKATRAIAAAFAPSLSPETVTPGEVEACYGIANNLLAISGVESTVNGIPAVVSDAYQRIEIEGQTYYGRIYKFLVSQGDILGDGMPAVVFDQTTDINVVTPNHLAVRFAKIGDRISLIVDNDLDPLIDQPEHLTAVRTLLQSLTDTQQKQQIRKRQDEESAAARQKARRREAVAGVARTAGKIARRAGAVAVAGVAVAAAVYGISKIDIKDFDDADLTLEGGTELVLGSTGSPQFSRELYDSDKLDRNDIPNLFDNTETGDQQLDMDNLFRDIEITSSKDGQNCESAEVERVPIGTRLVAWTDFTGPDGTSRADELEVMYTTEKVEVCWNGEELNDDDDPRVVVALRPEEESQPR